MSTPEITHMSVTELTFEVDDAYPNRLAIKTKALGGQEMTITVWFSNNDNKLKAYLKGLAAANEFMKAIAIDT